jgi:tetratricopeptide (TPR) repeat protein
VTSLLLKDALEEIDVNRLTILCGSGVSTPPPSSIPTVACFIRSCIQAADAPQSMCRAIEERMNGHPAPRFEVLVELIRSAWDPELQLTQIFDSPYCTEMHRYLAQAATAGAAVITTNFDTCIERAGPDIPNRMVFGGTDLHGHAPLSHVLVKAHGSHAVDSESSSELVISISALSRTARAYAEYPGWRSYLRALLDHRQILVLGYSGSDDFDIMPLLAESTPESVLWLQYDANAGLASEADRTVLPQSAVAAVDDEELRAFRGTFDAPGVSLRGPAARAKTRTPSAASGLTTEAWIEQLFPHPSDKRCLLATISLHHSVHEHTRGLLHDSSDARERSLLARALFYTGQYREALDTLGQLAGLHLPAYIEAQNAHIESGCYSYLGVGESAIDAARRFVALAEADDSHALKLEAQINLAAVLSYSQQYEEASRAYQRAASRLGDVPSLESLAKIRWGLADIALVENRHAEAFEGYRASLRIFEKLGAEIPVAWLERSQGEALLFMRELEDAEAALHRADRIFKKHTHNEGMAYVALDVARVSWLRGDRASCRGHAQRAIACLRRNVRSPIAMNAARMMWLASEATGMPYRSPQFSADFGPDAEQRVAEYHQDDPATDLLLAALRGEHPAVPDHLEAVESQLFPP